MNDLNKLVSRYYREQKLSSYRRNNLQIRLNQMATVEHPDSASVMRSIRDRTGWSIRPKLNWLHYCAAAMLLVLSVTLIRTNSIDGERSDKALHAAALYHKTKLQLDFEGPSFAQLQSSMHELPFELSLPTNTQLQGYKLVGGRYCSINGQLAVHLRFVDAQSSQQYSLFQTALAPQLERLGLADTEIDGMSVRLWSEGQNFYVQAGG